jgi:hypothetical protein
VSDVPNLLSPPLSVVVDTASTWAAMAHEADSAADVAFGLTTVNREYGHAGIFAACVGLVYAHLPEQATNGQPVIVALSPNGARTVEVDDAPPLLRALYRFISSLMAHDIEMAWSVFNSIDSAGVPWFLHNLLRISVTMSLISEADKGEGDEPEPSG